MDNGILFDVHGGMIMNAVDVNSQIAFPPLRRSEKKLATAE
jgi:hypothetical protein